MRDVLIESETSRIDESVRIVVTDLAAGQLVTLRATTRDGSWVDWSSEIVVEADSAGVVDLTRQAPLRGDYSGIDPVGLLWSMHPTQGTPAQFFAKRLPTPIRVEVEALVNGQVIARGGFTRHFGERVTARDPDDGIVGRLFSPAHDGPYPGVLVFGGSDGGALHHAGSLLASHGYTVLSLAYFGVEDRPKTLHNIDLEDLLDAITWLGSQPETVSSRVAVIGLSRGGELALQLAALSEHVVAVVAGAPSHLRHAGLTTNYTDFTQPAWRLHGQPLPFLPAKNTVRTFLGFLSAMIRRRPMRQRGMFERLTADSTRTEPAIIEVERIQAPLLLITGGDDQLWPSGPFAEQVLARRRQHDHDHDQHLDYPAAGHFVCFPYGLPSLPPMTRLSPPGPITMDFGGTAAANAAAAKDSWPTLLAYLATNLPPPVRQVP